MIFHKYDNYIGFMDKVNSLPHLNDAQIIGYAKDNFGLDINNQTADTILGQTQGDVGRVNDYFTQQRNSDPAYQRSQLLQNAQAVNDFYKQQNAPVVSTLQGAKTSLDDTYQKLVANIKGLGQDNVNNQTLATNNEEARRGILSSSGIYQQNMANALAPINNQTGANLNAAEQGYNSDAGNIALQIAQAQAGNPTSAISSANSLAQLAAQIYQNNTSNQLSRDTLNATIANNNKPAAAATDNYAIAAGPGQSSYLYNKSTGQYSIIGGGNTGGAATGGVNSYLGGNSTASGGWALS